MRDPRSPKERIKDCCWQAIGAARHCLAEQRAAKKEGRKASGESHLFLASTGLLAVACLVLFGALIYQLGIAAASIEWSGALEFWAQPKELLKNRAVKTAVLFFDCMMAGIVALIGWAGSDAWESGSASQCRSRSNAKESA